jgi:serine/threonine protein kinase/Tol biopolymer transport system component
MPVVGDNFLRYKIVSLIGSGGMGEVYLARDSQLERKVALKILKPKLSHRHGDALERFVLEARSASALNHPNIITIYEIGEAEGSHYIASEFVAGKTLHERINRRSLSLPDILNIAIQTAEALSAAHAAGIVHRDIKPENIMVRDDGYIKVLDFGLAKLSEYDAELADVDADTKRLVATNPGVVMGTVSYMSPEQARGLTVDKRTDIWSLGVVIYEMLTGQRPFTGDTTSDVIAALLKSEPEPIADRFPDTPHELERILGKALRKDREERYQNIKDLLIDLKDLRRQLDAQMRSDTASFGATRSENPLLVTGNGNVAAESTAPAAHRTNSISEIFISQFRLHPVLLTAIVAAAGLTLVFSAWALSGNFFKRSPAGFESMRFSKLTSIGRVEGGQVAVSPDGKYFAYVSREPGGRSLWVRQSNASGAVPLLPAAAIAYSGLTFSRDGSYIYYCAAEQNAAPAIFKVPVLGGEKRRLITDAEGPISFSPTGDRFVFIRNEAGLFTAREDGSDARPLAAAGDGNAWLFPVWSPDGQRVASALYTPKDNSTRLVEVSIDSGETKTITSPGWLRISGLAWLPDGSGLLLSGRDADTQFSQIWKLGYPDGGLTRVTNDATSYDGLSLASDGKSAVSVQVNRLSNIFVADEASPANLRQITTETGRDEGLSGVVWTPEGEIIYTTRIGAFQDLWTVERDGGNNRQLTFDSRSNFSPTVSPDGKYLVFVSTRSGDPNIWRSNRDGSEPLQLTSDPGIEGSPVISPDGRFVIYHLEDADNKMTLWKVSIDGGRPDRLTDVESSLPTVSPDGKLVAFRYGSTYSGKPPSIGIVPVEGPNEIRQLDLPVVANARYFRWSSDGKSIIYIDTAAGASRLLSQPISGGEPRVLADLKGRRIYSFDVSPRGKGIAIALGTETSEVLMVSNFR